MDLENCREEGQQIRQKKPLQGDSNDLSLKTREGHPLEGKGRYELYQAVCLNVQSQALPIHSQKEYPFLMQIIFSFKIIIPVMHYILLKHILIALKSVWVRGDSIDHPRNMLSVPSSKSKCHSPEMVNVSGGREVEMRPWGLIRCGFTGLCHHYPLSCEKLHLLWVTT